MLAPLRCNAENVGAVILDVAARYQEAPFDYVQWERSRYFPTPTIVEAAQALYRGHHVEEITRSDAGVTNLTRTTDALLRMIEHSKRAHRKSICFVTGVPGAGKTLVGLNIATQRADAERGEHAVFLSGNYPLVTVLQHALARDRVAQEGVRLCGALQVALRKTPAFIQIIHKYRDSFVGNTMCPPERIVLFDEAQRAWTRDAIQRFMKTKKGILNFPYSEPEFLIHTMDRHMDWAVIICLVGGWSGNQHGGGGIAGVVSCASTFVPELGCLRHATTQ